MINFLITVLLFIVSAVAKSECDTIRFTPYKAWSKSDFWLGKRNTKNRNWIFKYPLSFLWDGWHLMDSTRNVCFITICLLPLNLTWYWFTPAVVLGYATYGIIFEIFYQN